MFVPGTFYHSSPHRTCHSNTAQPFFRFIVRHTQCMHYFYPNIRVFVNNANCNIGQNELPPSKLILFLSYGPKRDHTPHISNGRFSRRFNEQWKLLIDSITYAASCLFYFPLWNNRSEQLLWVKCKYYERILYSCFKFIYK